MSCYSLPKDLCDRMLSMVLKFWWGNNNTSKNGIHWLAKDKLCENKNRGGIGFRRFDYLNEAFLMKQLWRILSARESLLSKVYRSRYIKDRNLWSLTPRPTDSHAWRSMCKIVRLFGQGITYIDATDTFRWNESSTGTFTVKSAYSFITRMRQLRNTVAEPSNWRLVEDFWKSFWKVKLPGRIKLLGWRGIHNILPVSRNLCTRGCRVEMSCRRCGFFLEDQWHVFIECWYAVAFWKVVGYDIDTRIENRDVADWLRLCMNTYNQSKLIGLLVGMWILWQNRNLIFHKEPGWSLEVSAAKFRFWCEQIHINHHLGWGGVADLRHRSNDELLVFCDGSWSKQDNGAGIACVAIKGDVVTAVAARNMASCLSSFHSECEAIFMGMMLAQKLEESKVCFCSDAAEVIWALQTGRCDIPGCDKVIADCAVLLASNMKWKLSFIPRDYNAAADWIANRARTQCWKWESVVSIPTIVAHCCTQQLSLF